METISISADKPLTDFNKARQHAVNKAEEILSDPVIIAWKDDTTGRFGPNIPGRAANRWYDYGVQKGGKLELTVDDEFHFIFSEAADYEKSDN